MIFVLLGRRNAWCLSRHNRAKSAEIHRFKAGWDLSLYPSLCQSVPIVPGVVPPGPVLKFVTVGTAEDLEHHIPRTGSKGQ